MSAWKLLAPGYGLLEALITGGHTGTDVLSK